MKKLNNLKWAPRWVSHLGCLKGCMDYHGADVSDAWLFGATGHAFVLNIADGVCPSGPTAWNTEKLYELARNAGCVIEGVEGSRYGEDLAELQTRAWEHVRRSIDDGLPCYGWELDVPEYYVIFGYDDIGYYYSGAGSDDGAGPKPWGEVGDTGIGCVEMRSVGMAEPADAEKTVRDALSFAIEFSEGPAKWVDKASVGGVKGFEAWARTLEEGRASLFGLGYNAPVWEQCRRFAGEFLNEVADRLDGRAGAELREAALHYGQVAASLMSVSEAYPFSLEHGDAEVAPVDDRSSAAAAELRKAGAAEREGLDLLKRALEKL